jgi:hypothetical protein
LVDRPCPIAFESALRREFGSLRSLRVASALQLVEHDGLTAREAFRTELPNATTGDLWGLILPAEGVRLRPLTRIVCGDDRPRSST